MSKIDKVLTTGKTETTVVGGGAKAGNHDLKLNLKLSEGSSATPGYVFDAVVAHPTAEQLFAGAWSACYTAALGLAAKAHKVVLPDNLAVKIEVDLGQTGNDYFLQARLNVHAPGLPEDVIKAVAHAADQICPYSKAVRGNIDVALNVITA